MKPNETPIGKVYLVGAGPGDPGLITLKGRQCIEAADVVVYDFLAAPALLGYASKEAEIIYVGKKGGDHTLPQEGINQLIVTKARAGAVVARLKGGDPFIFGRGGEEAEELIEAGIPYEVVPGVTSAISAPAYAGIPLTHRRYAASVSFVTGHEDPRKATSSLDWNRIAQDQNTLVFLMGVKNLPRIVQALIDHGKPPGTPIALVHWGTTPHQKTVTGTLTTIEAIVREAGITSPSIIVVGGVVTLRDKMQWFENRPLFGKKIIVTRAREQASDLVNQLTALGAACIECPTIKIMPPTDPSLLNDALTRMGSYDWIIFTSVNGVTRFFQRLFETGKDARALGHLKTACIGPATQQRLLDFGIKTDVLPKSYRAESVIESFESLDMRQKNVLLPRAEAARPILPEELRKMGARVDEVPVYSTVQDQSNREAVLKELEDGGVDMVTFTSSSTVENFKALIPADRFDALMGRTTVASIGPITSETAQKLGFTVGVTAETFTIPGLLESILQFYAE